MPDSVEAWMTRRERLHSALYRQMPHGDASQLEYALAGRRRFEEVDVAEMWERAGHTQRLDQHLNHVYVHVPFCKSICDFCNYRRLRPSHPDLLRRWLDRFRQSVQTLAPALKAHTFHTIYVGGGTPSVLPAPLVEEFLDLLDTNLNFARGSGRYVEMDPAVVSEAKVKAFVKHGFTHFSFGVQTFDKAINVAHNRGPQDHEMVSKRVRLLRKLGIAGVSFDFLLGLAGTTPDQILADIERALKEQHPRWIDVFFLTPTENYVGLHFGGSHEAFWEHERPFAEQVPDALRELGLRYGYEVHGSAGHTLTLMRQGTRFGIPGLGTALDEVMLRVERNPPKSRVGQAIFDKLNRQYRLPAYNYTQEVSGQSAPLNLLGLGYSARTRIFGEAVLTYHDPDDDPMSEGAAHYVGATTDLEHECRSYLLRVLRDHQWIDTSLVRDLFGYDVHDLVPKAIDAWRRLDRLEKKGARIRLRPADREADQNPLLFLYPSSLLEREIARVRNMDMGPNVVANLIAPLALGSEVDGWEVVGIEHALVLLERDGVRSSVRLRPALEGTMGVELAHDQGMNAVAAVLRANLSHNGAASMGLKQVDTPSEA